MDEHHLLGQYYRESVPPRYSDSYKFLRMSDDMHEVAQYLNDIRICFIVVTVTGYIFIFVYLIWMCIKRNRRNAPRRRNWDGYQVGKVADGNFSAATSNNEELTSVRTEAVTAAPYMRNHHSRLGADRNPPSFMRHGHLNHQQTTRLISEQDGSVVKHQSSDSSHHNGSSSAPREASRLRSPIG